MCIKYELTELAVHEALDARYHVGWVNGSLDLGNISKDVLGLHEGNTEWGDAVTLVVDNDFDTVVVPDFDAGLGVSKVNSDNSHF